MVASHRNVLNWPPSHMAPRISVQTFSTHDRSNYFFFNLVFFAVSATVTLGDEGLALTVAALVLLSGLLAARGYCRLFAVLEYVAKVTLNVLQMIFFQLFCGYTRFLEVHCFWTLRSMYAPLVPSGIEEIRLRWGLMAGNCSLLYAVHQMLSLFFFPVQPQSTELPANNRGEVAETPPSRQDTRQDC